MNTLFFIKGQSSVVCTHFRPVYQQCKLNRMQGLLFPSNAIHQRRLCSSIIKIDQSFHAKAKRNFSLLPLLITAIASFVLYQKSAVEAESVTDLDKLEVLTQTLNLSLPNKNEGESFGDWYKRCEQFCFDQVFQLVLNQEWTLINRLDENALSHLTDKWNRSLLIATVQEASTASVHKLIEKRIALLRRDEDGNTPLHIAAEMGRSDLIPKLSNLYHETTNKREETALHVAIKQGQIACIKALLNHGAKQTSCCKWNEKLLDPIALSVACGEREAFDTLVNNMAYSDIQQEIKGVGNLLHLAISTGKFPMLRHLLCEYDETKNLINKGDSDLKRSPLSLAAYLGDLEAIQFLIYEKKAATDTQDEEGRTAAHWAALGFQNEALELLGYLGVDLDRGTKKHLRPQDYLEKDSSEQAMLTLNVLRNLISQQEGRGIQVPDFNFRQPENIVFQGGGPRGIVYVGALKSLKQKGMLNDIHRVAGTSAGAITASLLAVGYSPEEIERISINFDLRTLLDPTEANKKLQEAAFKSAKSKSGNAILGHILKESVQEESVQDLIKLDPLRTYRKLSELEGLCEGEVFRLWIEERIREKTGKTHCTFGELQQLAEKKHPGAKSLYLYASRIDKKPEIKCFSAEGDKDVIISDAVRASMSIPGVFKPHTIHYKKEGKRVTYQNAEKYVDGGLLNNFPIDAFDSTAYQNNRLPKTAWLKETTNPHTLGIAITSEEDDSEVTVNGSKDLLMAIAGFYFKAEGLKQKPFNKDRVIEIPIHGVGLLDFDLTDEKKAELIQAGFAAVDTSPKFAKPEELQPNPFKAQFTNFAPSRVSNNFVGRSEFIKDLAHHFTSESYDSEARHVRVLFGLPGMGKTQIAMQFAKTHQGCFSQLFVIDCRTEALRDDGYRQIAEKLKIRTDGVPIEQIQRTVHRNLEDKGDRQRPWLLVLDNVDKEINAKQDLPAKGGCILITTNKKNVWNARNEIEEVGQFKVTEAIALLKSVIGENVNQEELASMNALAKNLGYFPLALNLAANYIGKNPQEIKKYLAAYEKQPLNAPWGKDYLYEYSLQKALGMTLDKLKRESEQAFEWLNICAYLNPDQIPEEWLNHWMKQKMGDESTYQAKSYELIKQLKNYALIQNSRTEQSFSIHGLFQQVLRERQVAKDIYIQSSLELVQERLQKFDRNDADTWRSSEKGYLHASWMVEEGILKNQDLKIQLKILSDIGYVAYVLGNFQKSLEYDEKSFAMEKQLYGDQPHPVVALSLNNLGVVWVGLGKYDKALEYHEKSFAMEKQLYSDRPHPDVANSLSNLGVVWVGLGKYNKALEYYEKSFAMNKHFYGDQPHPDVARSLNNLGDAWRNLGKYEKALEYYEKSFAMKKQLYGDQPHRDVALSLNNLGVVWSDLGKHDKSLEYHGKSFAMEKQFYGDQPHPDVARSLNNLGETWGNLGKYDRALEYHEKSFAMEKLFYGNQPHPDIARSLNNLGETCGNLGKSDEAKEYFTKAYVMYSQILGEDHPDTQRAKRNKEKVERQSSGICMIQ